MFLQKLIKTNPKLIKAAVNLYPKIGPNTYALDLDAIIQNTKDMIKEAKAHNVKLYQMTKQFGRNPFVAKAIAKAGIKKVVAVDPWEAMTMIENKLKLGNVGHVVQIPSVMLDKILLSKPDVVTVFSYENAANISKVLYALKLNQDIILRVVDPNRDNIYPSQEGAIRINDLKSTLIKMLKLKNINIIGFTSFPCIEYKNQKFKTTHNVKTIQKAIKIATDLGIKVTHINLPGQTMKASIKTISENKGSHGEPGHALIGTTPWHTDNIGEKPAIVYISEVSHRDKNKAYFYGGGHYRRSNMKEILLQQNKKLVLQKTIMPKPEAIDYYIGFKVKKANPMPGDIVIASFRTQVFMTRAKVAIISGISINKPKLIGLFDSQGKRYEK